MAISAGFPLAVPAGSHCDCRYERSGKDVVRVHCSVFSGCVLECPGVTENSQGLCSLLFLAGGVDGIDDFFPWNQDFADVFFHLGNEVGLRGAA